MSPTYRLRSIWNNVVTRWRGQRILGERNFMKIKNYVYGLCELLQIQIYTAVHRNRNLKLNFDVSMLDLCETLLKYAQVPQCAAPPPKNKKSWLRHCVVCEQKSATRVNGLDGRRRHSRSVVILLFTVAHPTTGYFTSDTVLAVSRKG